MSARKGARYLSAETIAGIQADYAAGASRASLSRKYRCGTTTIDLHVVARRPSELKKARASIARLRAKVRALREQVRALLAALEAAGIA